MEGGVGRQLELFVLRLIEGAEARHRRSRHRGRRPFEPIMTQYLSGGGVEGGEGGEGGGGGGEGGEGV